VLVNLDQQCPRGMVMCFFDIIYGTDRAIPPIIQQGNKSAVSYGGSLSFS
jgi:hypothetical protein